MPVGPFAAATGKGLFAKFLGTGFGAALKSNLETGSANTVSNLIQEQGGKLLGIPSQDQKLKNTMDKLYPGTNPWERLGGVGSGVASQALGSQVRREQQRTQQHIADKTIAKDKEVARIQAQAQVKSAEITAAPKATVAPSEVDRNVAQKGLMNEQAISVARQVQPLIDRMSAQEQQALTTAVKLAFEGKIAEAQAEVARQKAAADTISKEFGFLAPLINLLRFDTLASAWQKAPASIAVGGALGAAGVAKYGAKFSQALKQFHTMRILRRVDKKHKQKQLEFDKKYEKYNKKL